MKEIKNFEELYQVNELGQIWSIKNKKYLKQTLSKNGYLYVGLHKNKIRKNYYIHRLVAEAFIEIPEELKHLKGTRYLQVNHKDENKQNNVVSNLEWCDVKYNNEYNNGQKRRAIKHLKPILQYTLDGEFVREWESAIQAKIEGGFNNTCICQCCRGDIKYHKGFIFKYK